jgi:hypothetical protein
MSSWPALRQICLYQVLIAKYHIHSFPLCTGVGQSLGTGVGQSLGTEIGVALVALFKEKSIGKLKVKVKVTIE